MSPFNLEEERVVCHRSNDLQEEHKQINKQTNEQANKHAGGSCKEIMILSTDMQYGALTMAVASGGGGGGQGGQLPPPPAPVKKPPLKNNWNQNTYLNILGV